MILILLQAAIALFVSKEYYLLKLKFLCWLFEQGPPKSTQAPSPYTSNTKWVTLLLQMLELIRIDCKNSLKCGSKFCLSLNLFHSEIIRVDVYSLDTATNSQRKTSFNFNVIFCCTWNWLDVHSFSFFPSSLYYYNFFV